MTQGQFVAELSKRTGLPKQKLRAILKEIRWALKTSLRLDGEYMWPQLGTFRLKAHKARRIINPATKKPMKLRRRVAVKFHASKHMALGLRPPKAKAGNIWGWDVAAKKLRGEG